MAAFEIFDPSVTISIVQASRARMRVAQVGSGPDIIWIPGGDSPAEAWQPQMLHFADRDPQSLIDQWQACLDFDCREALKTCPVPIHAMAFSEDIQTPPSMVRAVSECAKDGHYHEIPGLGHVSLTRHQPGVVNAKIAEIIEAQP